MRVQTIGRWATHIWGGQLGWSFGELSKGLGYRSDHITYATELVLKTLPFWTPFSLTSATEDLGVVTQLGTDAVD